MDNELSKALHSAIGSNTRVFLAKVVALDNVDDGRVTAYSEFLGNLNVVVGNIRWLRIDDWIFVSRAASEEKYQPYLYLGWAGNQQGITPGSPTLFNSEITTLSTDLPDYSDGARIGEMRSVGGTVNELTGLTTGNTIYIYANVNGLDQWVQAGGGVSVAAQRSFGWFQPGIVTPGTQIGPVYTMDVAMDISSIAYHVKIADGSNPVTIDIRKAPTADPGDVFTSVLTSTLSFNTGGSIVSGFLPTLIAGNCLCFDIVSYAGAIMTDLTVQVFLASVELP